MAFSFNVLASTPYRFSGDLSAVGRNSMALFFNNTATMRLDLPPGMSMNSGSGVFLTPIPEPSQWMLLAGGLGLVGWRATRRRTARA